MIPIRSKVSLDTSELSKGLTRAEKRLGTFKKSVSAIGGAIGAAFAVRSVRQWANELDRIGKLSTRLNVGAQELQSMAFAAEKGGADLEQMANAFTRLTRKASDLENTGIADAFAELNINQEEFIKLSLPDQLVALSEAFKSAENRGAAFQSLFSLLEDDAKQLLPLLESGGQAIKDAMAEAVTATDAQVRAAERLNDELAKIENTLVGPKAAMASFASDALAAAGAVLTIGNGDGKNKTKGGSLIRDAYENSPNAKIAGIIASMIRSQDLLEIFYPEDAARLGQAEAKAQERRRNPGYRNQSPRVKRQDLVYMGDEEYGPPSMRALVQPLLPMFRAMLNIRDSFGSRNLPGASGMAASLAGGMGTGGKDMFALADARQRALAGIPGQIAVADSLARVGGGGNVATRANPELKAMQEQVAKLDRQIGFLQTIATNTGKETTLRP